MADDDILFDERFLERHAGAIIADPKVAIVELVANCWDAYATEVNVSWPNTLTNKAFSIADNGIGMTADQFERRWRTIDYNRVADLGKTVAPPARLSGANPRPAYGRNGKGRHAAFLFSTPYEVRTWRDGTEVVYRVRRGSPGTPFKTEFMSKGAHAGHGTIISATGIWPVGLTSDQAREIIGTRFLTDPRFQVKVDGKLVTFDDISAPFLHEAVVTIEGLGDARIVMIDAQRADRTTMQHGIAWRVGNRLVGDIGWKSSDYERVLDGRTSEAKRYTFIVFVDFLADAVKPDWSDFEPLNKDWKKARPIIQDRIRTLLADVQSQRRSNDKDEVRERLSHAASQLSPASRDRWDNFVDSVIDSCPGISTEEVTQVAGILAKLEISTSKYGLLQKLHGLEPGDLDDLHEILSAWTVRTAKIALDEIKTRLSLIEQLDQTLAREHVDEVKDIQPLIGQSLWVFGPEFESIEFTSNKGMTTVIREIFGHKERASRERPDFVILPNSSVGFYSCDSFGDDHEVSGVSHLVVVEIKSPDVPIGTAEKGEPWGYVQELIERGYVSEGTRVTCFALGKTVKPTELGPRRDWGDRVVTYAMTYDTFLKRAEARLLNLRKKLSEAPFLKEQGLNAQDYLDPESPGQKAMI